MRVFSEQYKDKRPNGDSITKTRWVAEWDNGFKVFTTQRSALAFSQSP